MTEGFEKNPVFSAPWEAQAFAMAVALYERGCFTWTEWSSTLAEVIAEAKDQRYYEHWLTALERIVERKALVAPGMLERRRREWEEAALRTPHGQPIEL